jgi:hypothetical protein
MRLLKLANHRAGDDALKHELCDGFSMVHFGVQAGENLAFYCPSWITGDSTRQQTPYRCQSRNHGLCASISSCRRFAADRSLALSGLISGASNISSSCSMSSIVRSMSIPSQFPHHRANRQRERYLRISTVAPWSHSPGEDRSMRW